MDIELIAQIPRDWEFTVLIGEESGITWQEWMEKWEDIDTNWEEI